MRHGHSTFVFFACLALSALFGATASASEDAAWVKRSGPEIGLGNQFLELWLRAGQNRVAAVRLVNHLANRTIPLKSDDFSVGLEGRPAIRAADFAFKEARDEAIPGGKRLTLRFEGAPSGTRLDVVYELADADFFLRRRLELTAKKPLALRQVDVWLVGLDGKPSHQGFGEPVLLDDTFWGVEFPAGHNQLADGVVKLTQFPGCTTDRFTSKTAVLGVSEPGRVARRFQQYVETFRVTSPRTSLFVNYNTWWTLMPPTEKNALELIDLFKRKLFDPYGESIDTFTLDDGWDVNDSLWDIDAKALPRGFQPLVEPLESMNARLGIWLSPSSGYSHAPWLSTHGYQANSNPWYVCQSDPKYRRDIAKRVTELAKKYEVAFFKFDGFCATCDAKGHAHLPGPYAQEANVDAFIELLTAVRQARPGIYLDPTCGIWLSPWWLRYADSLWGEVSGDYPDIIVPAPIVRDSATTTRDAMFRQRCREHPGFPPAAIEHLGIIVITPEKWEDNAMIVVGRGCRLLTLYIDPKHFTKGDRDWAFLASLLKWVRHNAETLKRTELILGDPMQREPYGYAHFSGPRGILAIRNPFIEPKTLALKLDESMGWSKPEARTTPPGGRFAVRMVYPRHEVLSPIVRYGDVLRLHLQGYETAIVQLEAVDPARPVLVGARYQETGRTGNRATYAVFARPGQKLDIPFLGMNRPVKASLDGRPVAPAATQHGTALPLVWAGTERACQVEDPSLAADGAEADWRIAGKCVAVVPEAAKAAMHVLCDPRGKLPGEVDCVARVNGKPAEVRAVRTLPKGDQAHGPHPWTWFAFDLPGGRSEVSFALSCRAKGTRFVGQVGWWLWAEHPLTKSALEIEYAEPLPELRPEPLPLPIKMDHEQEVLSVRRPTLFRLGARWPKTPQPVVHLDEIAPDEVVQDYGKLEKNRSVWEKEMIIAGKTFGRGVGTHANGRAVFDLTGGGFKTFRCQVGRDEHAGDGRVVFEVWVDGKKAFNSGPMQKTTPAKAVEVNIQGAATLELRALDGGDGISGDHANWAEAQLVR